MTARSSPAVAVATLWACLALVACGGTGGTSSVRGKLTVSHDRYDFGQVPLGELREHTFTITNTGSGVLELQEEATVKAVEGC